MIKRNEIQYRVSRTTERGAIFLIYIDARTCARELDELYGTLLWQFDWRRSQEEWAVKGTLSIWNKEIKEWVKYSDVGYPNEAKTYEGGKDFQWLKDAVSDALKRCGVQANVGRELYDAPFLYTEECEFYTDKNGKKRFKKLTEMGKKMIEGSIDKWYTGLTK
jgi:hypothetical protein